MDYCWSSGLSKCLFRHIIFAISFNLFATYSNVFEVSHCTTESFCKLFQSFCNIVKIFCTKKRFSRRLNIGKQIEILQFLLVFLQIVLVFLRFLTVAPSLFANYLLGKQIEIPRHGADSILSVVFS